MSDNNNLPKQQTAMTELLSVISGVLEYSQNPLLQQVLDAGNNLLKKEQQQIEGQKLEFAIEQLKEVDFNMCKLIRQEAINFDLSQEEATYKWRRTKWHLEIISKIKELEQKLSEL